MAGRLRPSDGPQTAKVRGRPAARGEGVYVDFTRFSTREAGWAGLAYCAMRGRGQEEDLGFKMAAMAAVGEGGVHTSRGVGVYMGLY